jgi:hypothetical protein
MSNKFKVLLGAVVVVVLGLGAVTGTVLAQGGSGQENPEPGALCDRFVEGVASQLGVTAADVEAAFRGAKLDMVDEAVASGKITADQAGAGPPGAGQGARRPCCRRDRRYDAARADR